MLRIFQHTSRAARPVRLGSVFALLLAGHAAAQAVGVDLEKTIDGYAESFIAGEPAAGLSVAVARGETLIYAKGFGFADLENSVPATPETVYRIGSITKSFTAAAILQLVEDGALGLDSTLGEVLPDYPEPGRQVTIRELLNHTSGIPSFTSFPEYDEKKREDLDHEAVLDWFADRPLEFEPGSAFRYSNSGYYVLGLVIERVSGRRYDEYLKENVLGPAGLSATRYDWWEPIVPHRARGYVRVDGTFAHADYVSMHVPYAAGALASTAPDLVRWVRALSTGMVISESSFALMVSPTKLPGGRRHPYGFGLALTYIEDQRAIRHNGGIDGFRSHLAHVPDAGWIIAVLTNTEDTQPAALVDKIAGELLGD